MFDISTKGKLEALGAVQSCFHFALITLAMRILSHDGTKLMELDVSANGFTLINQFSHPPL